MEEAPQKDWVEPYRWLAVKAGHLEGRQWAGGFSTWLPLSCREFNLPVPGRSSQAQNPRRGEMGNGSALLGSAGSFDLNLLNLFFADQ
jgi:hypothetical protein